MSTSMRKGHKAGKQGAWNAKGAGGPGAALRQSADKGARKHVTISEEHGEEAASQSPSQSQSYYGDEFESLSKSHVSASRRTSKERRASKGRQQQSNNTSASQSYSQNFDESRASETRESGKKGASFSAKRKSAEVLSEKYSPIKE